MSKPYIPSVIPQEDLANYPKAAIDNRSKPGNRPALLVVDMTRAFVEDRYPTGFSKTGVPCAENIARLLKTARAKGIPVFYSKLLPRRNPAELGRWRQRGSKLSPEEERAWDESNQIVPVIAPLASEYVLEKSKPSMFFGTQLISLLNFHGIDTVIVTGMITSACIRSTVIDAFSYNYHVLVPIECVADRLVISHEVNLFEIDMRYGLVLPLDEVLVYLDKL